MWKRLRSMSFTNYIFPSQIKEERYIPNAKKKKKKKKKTFFQRNEIFPDAPPMVLHPIRMEKSRFWSVLELTQFWPTHWFGSAIMETLLSCNPEKWQGRLGKPSQVNVIVKVSKGWANVVVVIPWLSIPHSLKFACSEANALIRS